MERAALLRSSAIRILGGVPIRGRIGRDRCPSTLMQGLLRRSVKGAEKGRFQVLFCVGEITGKGRILREFPHHLVAVGRLLTILTGASKKKKGQNVS